MYKANKGVVVVVCVRIADQFYYLDLHSSSTFDTPWKFFYISVVLTEKQLQSQCTAITIQFTYIPRIKTLE